VRALIQLASLRAEIGWTKWWWCDNNRSASHEDYSRTELHRPCCLSTSFSPCHGRLHAYRSVTLSARISTHALHGIVFSDKHQKFIYNLGSIANKKLLILTLSNLFIFSHNAQATQIHPYCLLVGKKNFYPLILHLHVFYWNHSRLSHVFSVEASRYDRHFVHKCADVYMFY
jgi:hypothetical protein